MFTFCSTNVGLSRKSVRLEKAQKMFEKRQCKIVEVLI